MKMNQRPELILCMTALSGLTRELTSRYAQTKLFEFGYKWANDTTKPLHLRKPMLNVCTHKRKAHEITYSEGLPFSFGLVIMFDATRDLNEFLSRAERALKESRIINGIVATITPHNIDLNVSELVAKTTSEAQKIQAELFGSGLGSSPCLMRGC